MRLYRTKHAHTCGVDLHTRTMYLCILGPDGEPVLQKNTPASPGAFLKAVEPYREDLVVGVECIFTADPAAYRDSPGLDWRRRSPAGAASRNEGQTTGILGTVSNRRLGTKKARFRRNAL